MEFRELLESSELDEAAVYIDPYKAVSHATKLRMKGDTKKMKNYIKTLEKKIKEAEGVPEYKMNIELWQKAIDKLNKAIEEA